MPVQKRIAAFLGTLDSKIFLNHQQNATLEAAAREVYRSWFVDFDPVRARLDGRRPHGMDDATAALFPDRIEHGDAGELLPVGWDFLPVGEVLEVKGGATPSTKNSDFWIGGTHCWATPKDLSGLGTPILQDTSRHITDAGVAKISSGLLPPGTVLLSSRAPVGYTAITVMPCAVNQGFIAMVCPPDIPNVYVMQWVESSMPEILNRASGTTFAEISKRSFRPILFLKPSPEVLSAFGETVGPLYDLIGSNDRESRTLAELRDALLPKLLSGELTVPAAEALIDSPAEVPA